MNTRTSSKHGYRAGEWMIGKTTTWLTVLLSLMFAWGSASSQTAVDVELPVILSATVAPAYTLDDNGVDLNAVTVEMSEPGTIYFLNDAGKKNVDAATTASAQLTALVNNNLDYAKTRKVGSIENSAYFELGYQVNSDGNAFFYALPDGLYYLYGVDQAQNITATPRIVPAGNVCITPSSVTLSKTAAALIKSSDPASATTDVLFNILPVEAVLKTATWTSSAPTQVSVAANGLTGATLTGLAATTSDVTITAKYTDCSSATEKTLTMNASVTALVSSIAVYHGTTDVSGEVLKMKIGEKLTLSSEVLPADATDKTVTWTTTGSAVTVLDGVVTAVAVGQSTVTATSGGKSATVTIDGELAMPTAIIVKPAELSYVLGVDAAKDIVVGFNPDANVDDRYTITDEGCAGIVTIAGNSVTPVALGNCKITVTSIAVPTLTKEIAVSVKPEVRVASVTVSAVDAIQYVGARFYLTATVEPTDATVQTVTWSSSDKTIATVSATGRVVVVGTGNVTITATSDDAKATPAVVGSVVFTTQKRLITAITPSVTSIELKFGENKIVSYTYEDALAADDITITSDNENIAKVSGKTVTAVNRGTANIIFTSASTGKTVLVPITVTTSCNENATSIVASASTTELVAGSIATLKGSILPASVCDPTVKWTVTEGAAYVTLDVDAKTVTPNVSAIPADVKSVTATVTASDTKGNYSKAITFTISHNANVSSIASPAFSSSQITSYEIFNLVGRSLGVYHRLPNTYQAGTYLVKYIGTDGRVVGVKLWEPHQKNYQETTPLLTPITDK
jgi:uncharacterized protein YjdB